MLHVIEMLTKEADNAPKAKKMLITATITACTPRELSSGACFHGESHTCSCSLMYTAKLAQVSATGVGNLAAHLKADAAMVGGREAKDVMLRRRVGRSRHLL